VPLGEAIGCAGNYNMDAHARIDLRGTPFAFHEEQEFKDGGWASKIEVTFSENR